VSQALNKLAEEDPSLRVARDPHSKDIILSGVGQLHVEVTVERLKRKYGVERRPAGSEGGLQGNDQGKADCQGKYKKQSGGRGQYGDTWLKIEPLPAWGFEFVREIRCGVIPRQYIPGSREGHPGCMAEGVIAARDG